MTNSHCTQDDSIGGNNTAHFHQPTPVSSAGNYIGTEVEDPKPLGTCIPEGQIVEAPCRYSDAALVGYDSTNVGWEFGFIARTEFPATGMDTLGSRVIDHSNPRFKITGEQLWPTVGEVLEKIGRTTGWTEGKVSETCKDKVSQGTWILCQDKMDASALGGDSGSPAFGWPSLASNEVVLYGLVWAGDQGYFWFSAMSNMEYDDFLGGGDLITH